jgi:dTDP-4-amino-4,6-dideoxygalactose transaminase
MKFPRGSEVITTPFTFISTTHAIVRNGLQPVFCDIKLSDYTIDEDKIEELITEKTVAIVPVHVYGNVCAVEKIQQIAEKYNLKVIYDAAHAFGVSYKGKGIGNFGNASAFSFHATKVFNTIEGGAVTFRNPELNTTLYNLKNFGIRSEEVVAEVGANAKMNEFAAAMGLCNLRHLDEEIAKRKKVVAKYRELLKNIKGIYFLKIQSDIEWNYAYFPIRIEEKEFGKTRDEVYDWLRKNNIFSRKYFYPLTSDQACFRNKYINARIQNARYVAERILVLPLYADLELGDVERIVWLIKNFSEI